MAPKVHDENSRKFIPAKELFKNTTRLLHIFCLYFPKGSENWKTCLYLGLHLVFACFTWSNALRQFFVVWRSDGTSSFLVSVGLFIYYIGMAYLSTSSCYSVTKYYHKLLFCLDEYRVIHGEFVCIKKLRTVVKFLFWNFIFCLPVACAIYSGSLLNDVVWNGIGVNFYPFTKNTLTDTMLMIIYCFFVCYIISTASNLLLLLYISISCLVVWEVNNINETFRQLVNDTNCQQKLALINRGKNMSKTSGTVVKILVQNQFRHLDNLEDQFEVLRHKYENILDIVSKATLVLEHFLFSTLAMTVPVTCMVLYGFITQTGNVPQLVFIGVTNMNIFTLLFWILVIGAYVSNKLKQPLENAMKIDMRNLPDTAKPSVMLFSVRYLSCSLGYNVYGLFDINSGTILTIFGTLLTYAVVIYQFAQTPPSCNTMLNNVTSL